MAFVEKNVNTYELELSEENQQEALEAYKETLKHMEENNDSVTAFYKGTAAAGAVITVLMIFREPIANGVKAGARKVKGFFDEKIFHKATKDHTPDKDGIIDAEFTEVEKES